MASSAPLTQARPRMNPGMPGHRAEQRRLPCGVGSGALARSGGYGVTQPMEPTGKSLPVEVAVKPKVTLPSGGMIRL